jgi:3-oxoacyl-[acyl-carrier protein] reductase
VTVALLDNQVAVITGAAQGIGYAIATTLHEHGAHVVIADLDPDLADAAAQRLTAESNGHAGATGARCNVTSEDDVRDLVESTVKRHGGLHVFVNNAGITRDKTLRKMTSDQFRSVVDVHLYGAWLGTKYAAEAMRPIGRGAIVNISSISGKVGMFGQTNYSAAKAGMVGLTKASAKELAIDGIRVNAIQPGLIRTPMTEAIPAFVYAAKLAEIPLGRAGEPSEIGSVVLFLASDLSSYVTGIVVEVAGGRHI